MQAVGRAVPIEGRARRLLYLTALAGLAADQITKAVAVARLGEGESVSVIKGVWHWTLQRNPGAAFSLFQRIPVVFTLIAFAISIGIVWYSRRVGDAPTGFALGLVLAGATGNLADRLFRPPGPFRGHVIDFIDFRIWPTFNVADICVVGGAALLFLASVRAERRAARSSGDAAKS